MLFTPLISKTQQSELHQPKKENNGNQGSNKSAKYDKKHRAQLTTKCHRIMPFGLWILMDIALKQEKAKQKRSPELLGPKARVSAEFSFEAKTGTVEAEQLLPPDQSSLFSLVF